MKNLVWVLALVVSGSSCVHAPGSDTILVGDDSAVSPGVYVWPEGTCLDVFDIDGTLTNGLVSDDARRDAASVTHRRAVRTNEKVVYLTSRHKLLADITRYWLKSKGMADGPVIFSDSILDMPSTIDAAGQYKLKQLLRLKELGFKFCAGYGDQVSDIFAYENAGIAKQNIFIVGQHGGEQGTVALGPDFSSHLKEL